MNKAQNPPSQTYSTAKTYTVSLVVTGPGGISPATTQTITVNPPQRRRQYPI